MSPRQLHFIGIGGIGMSALAHIALQKGWRVTGTDLSYTKYYRALQKLGAQLSLGHDAPFPEGTQSVIMSSAIKPNNPEYLAAQSKGIPIQHRAEFLAELMANHKGLAFTGTHGKTTQSALAAHVLKEAKQQPSYAVGANFHNNPHHAELGKGPYFIAEADESDGSFLHLAAHLQAAVINNIDKDHLEHHDNTLASLASSFKTFANAMPPDACLIINADDPQLAACFEDHSIIGYGRTTLADYQLIDRHQNGALQHIHYHAQNQAPRSFSLQLPGEHNAYNALGVLAVAHQQGLDLDTIEGALSSFTGLDRRFNLRHDGASPWGNITLIDDYAHHPKALAYSIEAAQSRWPNRRLKVIFQPHRYTRTRDLFNEFVGALMHAPELILLPTYTAGETLIPGADANGLLNALQNHRHPNCSILTEDALKQHLNGQLNDGDCCLFMGAGSISEWLCNWQQQWL